MCKSFATSTWSSLTIICVSFDSSLIPVYVKFVIVPPSIRSPDTEFFLKSTCDTLTVDSEIFSILLRGNSVI